MTAPREAREALEALQAPVVAHYEDRLRRHGPTAQGMDWKDAASQRLRFRILAEIGDLQGRSVHDLGAGAGHLWDFLLEEDVRAEYSGSDLSRAMVEAARRRHPGVRFERRDVLAEPLSRTYDVVICSGLFHVKLEADEASWRELVHAVLRRMYDACSFGIAFNLMSDQVDFREPRLFYASPGDFLEFCRGELSRRVVVRHDYPLYEWTAYVYRPDADR